MSEYIILTLCILIILAYIFDITSGYSKIPGVILLIILGIVIHLIADSVPVSIPNLKPLLPVTGTLGLIMIVMEASLDIELRRSKKSLIIKSISAALALATVLAALLSLAMVKYFGVPLRDAMLNAIPLSIISSSIAIPSSARLGRHDREFIVYETSFSDIFGIMLFDFIMFNENSIGVGLFTFVFDGVATVIIALLATGLLGYLLHRTRYHVNYVIILTFIVLIYTLAKLIHFPGLLLILIFGLVLANNRFLEKTFIARFIEFPKFRNDITSFKKILVELTFLVRSFFFIMFGFYTNISGLAKYDTIMTGVIITAAIFVTRWLYFHFVLKLPARPLMFFAPRGLITILLFLSIPATSRYDFANEEVVTVVILLTIVVMTAGNLFQRKKLLPEEENKAD